MILILSRWGPQLEQATYKNRQRLYLSEQVSLLLVGVEISNFDWFIVVYFFFLEFVFCYIGSDFIYELWTFKFEWLNQLPTKSMLETFRLLAIRS